MTSFTHLHVHTEYSLLDGACRIKQLVARAAELGQTSLAITDHGVMYGVIDFWKECKKAGIRPVIGCEVYVAPGSRLDKKPGGAGSVRAYHLILLCKDIGGYYNLIKLVSCGHLEGFYGKPRVDRELLAQYHEGLIALSGCLAGEVAQDLLAGDRDAAKAAALWYRDTFGTDDYYLEIQDHGLPDDERLIPALRRLSEETGIPLAATNDAHYIAKKDSYAQMVLMCIQTAKTVDDPARMDFGSEEFYLKSGDEMAELFRAVPEAIANTEKIAARCDVEFTFGKLHLPSFPVPDGQSHEGYLRRLCDEGFARRYGDSPAEGFRERLDYELSVIEKMGYVDYFLIVQDFIMYAKRQSIPVGPGRGSAAGSMAAFCLGITEVDPMRYALLFERFLNPERVSMPDIDTDFCYVRRPEVIEYVVRKYGEDHVAQIITFGTMAAKLAVKDVGRALNMPYARVDAVSKLIPNEPNITLERALELSAPLRELTASDADVQKLLELARKLEGMPRHASTHAAGVVITKEPVSAYVPLQRSDESVVTQFTMGTLEELGLLKMDFLGLRNLTIIRDAENIIRRGEPDFAVDRLTFDDPAVYELLSAGDTMGVFQLESTGIRNVLTGLRPKNFEDIIAVISLYRPGPMESIPKYIECKNHPERVSFKTPLVEEILRPTYGCIVYQEQVMQIVQRVAGYSYGRADLVRRAMAKKKADVMQKERQNFVYGGEGVPGAVKNGVPAAVAESLFDEMAAFASYAFNKSHATAYAIVAYQTAWLKAHHPAAYFAALLNSVIDQLSAMPKYIAECERHGIAVLPPDINESGIGFEATHAGVRFGLAAIKNIGRSAMSQLVAEREKHGPFQDLPDLLRRLTDGELNKKAVESLIKAGALDAFGVYRSRMLHVYEDLMDGFSDETRRNVAGQMNLFDSEPQTAEVIYPAIDELRPKEKLLFEKEVTGLYLSGHPLSEYADRLRQENLPKIAELQTAVSEEDAPLFSDGDIVRTAGIVTARKLKTTRSDATMAFVELEDETGSLEMVVFPRTLERYDSLLMPDTVILVHGRLSTKDDEVKLLPDQIDDLNESSPAARMNADRRARCLYLRFPTADCEEKRRALKLVRIFDGTFPLSFYYADTKTYDMAPRELFVENTPELVSRLAALLGDENVSLR